MAADDAWSGRTVQAPMGYFGAAPEKPTFHAQDHGLDNWRADTHEITFHDGRTWATAPSLDRERFALASHRTKVKDFTNREETRAVYGPELEALIRELTGAKRVVAYTFGHVRYSPRTPSYKTGSNSQPAHFPHVDCTPNTSHGLVPSRVFGLKQEVLQPGEYLVGYNIWRVISEPPQDMPLAVCDARTVARDDLIEADGVYDFGDPPWMTSEAYLVRHNPAHRWVYFKDMRPDEALVFRGFGNEPEWIAGVPHCAFQDPTCPADAPGRISVEAHAYAVFDS